MAPASFTVPAFTPSKALIRNLVRNHRRIDGQPAWYDLARPLILSITAFIARVLSAVYVPFQNMVGNTGFYVASRFTRSTGLA